MLYNLHMNIIFPRSYKKYRTRYLSHAMIYIFFNNNKKEAIYIYYNRNESIMLLLNRQFHILYVRIRYFDCYINLKKWFVLSRRQSNTGEKGSPKLRLFDEIDYNWTFLFYWVFPTRETNWNRIRNFFKKTNVTLIQ